MKLSYLAIGLGTVLCGCNRVEYAPRVSASMSATPAVLALSPTPTPKTDRASITASEKLQMGLYRAQIIFHNSGGPGFYDEQISFKWIRLFKNGTYTTSQFKQGKIEGRWLYDRKTYTITFKNAFKNPYTDTGPGYWNEKHQIYNNLKGDNQLHEGTHVIYWAINEPSSTGFKNLVWEKP